MGRSQVKYRTTHGRGRGRGSGNGSASGGRGGGGASTRGQGGGRRPLESNAFRYDEERDGDNDDNEQHDGNVQETQDARAYAFRRQFFAGEENVREVGATPSGAYFQSKTVKQWDADDEDDTDIASGKNAAGVLDFHWLGEQLAMVAPSVRYQMDPKYCVDFAFEPHEAHEVDSDSANEALVDKAQSMPQAAVLTATAAVSRPTPPSSVSQQTPQAPTATASTTADSELDLLLELSSSALPSALAPAPLAPVSAAPTTTTTVAAHDQQQHQHQRQQSDEDWLDDVLDM